MFLNTQPWDALRKTGTPDLVVWRSPLTIDGRVLKAGDRFPIEGTQHVARQLWDLNKITTAENFGVVPEQKKTKRVKQ
jgi:hypothetical protein